MSSKFSSRNNRAAKLRITQVLEIRDRYQAGESQGALAREFGISIVQIGRIVRGESWQYLERPPTEVEKQQAIERLLQTQREVDLYGPTPLAKAEPPKEKLPDPFPAPAPDALEKLAADIRRRQEELAKADQLVDELKEKNDA